jgi:hypothetical protein
MSPLTSEGPVVLELIALIWKKLDEMIPIHYRVQLVACLAFMGLFGWIWLSMHLFANASIVNIEISTMKQQVVSTVQRAVQPVVQQIQKDEQIGNYRYLDDLNDKILNAAGQCREAKNAESRMLYQASLTNLLEHYVNAARHPYPNDTVINSCKP